jgi:cell wall-associated NlpC family hydrolase
MSRRTTRRRAACGLVAAALATTGLAAPAHAFTTFTKTDPTPAGGAADRERSPLAAAVKAAKGRIGSSYAMGATGPGAFDCSGLTTYAFQRAGVALPRTSQAQYGVGKAVSRSEIRAGDLVFFSTNGPGPSHVGVATGRDTVVSATSSGGVMEHPSTDAYWGGSYVGARRPAA